MTKLKWTDKELKYFRRDRNPNEWKKYIRGNTKRTDDINEWSWWLLFGAVIIMEVVVIGKIIGII